MAYRGHHLINRIVPLPVNNWPKLELQLPKKLWHMDNASTRINDVLMNWIALKGYDTSLNHKAVRTVADITLFSFSFLFYK